MLGFFKVSPYALKMTSFCMNYCIIQHFSGVVASQVAGIAAFKSPALTMLKGLPAGPRHFTPIQRQVLSSYLHTHTLQIFLQTPSCCLRISCTQIVLAVSCHSHTQPDLNLDLTKHLTNFKCYKWLHKFRIHALSQTMSTTQWYLQTPGWSGVKRREIIRFLTTGPFFSTLYLPLVHLTPMICTYTTRTSLRSRTIRALMDFLLECYSICISRNFLVSLFILHDCLDHFCTGVLFNHQAGFNVLPVV